VESLPLVDHHSNWCYLIAVLAGDKISGTANVFLLLLKFRLRNYILVCMPLVLLQFLILLTISSENRVDVPLILSTTSHGNTKEI
jgi:hypothetical protein